MMLWTLLIAGFDFAFDAFDLCLSLLTFMLLYPSYACMHNYVSVLFSTFIRTHILRFYQLENEFMYKRIRDKKKKIV